LTDCGLVGIWKHRDDFGDGGDNARALRERAQRRNRS